MSIDLHALSNEGLSEVKLTLEASLKKSSVKRRVLRWGLLCGGYFLLLSIGLKGNAANTVLEVLMLMPITALGMVLMFAIGAGHGKSGAMMIGTVSGGGIISISLYGQFGALIGIVSLPIGMVIGAVLTYFILNIHETLDDEHAGLYRQWERVQHLITLPPGKAHHP